MSVVSEEEPAAKRMKNSDEFPNLRAEVAGPVKEKLMELDAVQHQLDVMSEKAAEEILKVEQTFNKKRMPIYEKRKKLTTQIDSFWQVAFLNHHLLSTAIPEEQEDLLAAMRDLEVQEFDDLRSGFKIIMTFDKNPYFENEVIIKSYHLQSESPSTEITEIQWKENRKPAEKLDDVETSITFLEWLTYAAPPDSDEIAEVIKDDLYINPLQYYVMPDMQEVEEDDIEDFLNERKIDENGQPLLPLRNDIFIAPLMMPRRDVDDSGDKDDEPEEKMEEDLNGAEVKAEEDGDETVEPEDADETVGDTEAGDEEEEDEEDEEEEEDGEPAREAEDGEPADEEDTKDEVKEEIFENEHIHLLQMQALNTLPIAGQLAQHHNVLMDQRRRGERRMQKPESYKTVICQAWLESKTCTFAENCRFAHGEEELRPSIIEPRQNNKYKTKLCDKYTTTGLCPYGKRCLFIHPDHGPNAYIRADKLYEVSQRHALADLRDQMENQIMSGGRSVPQTAPDMLARPTTPVEPAVKVPSVPLGPTPVSARGPRYELPSRTLMTPDVAGSLPPPSWPLEPSSFFSLENPNLTSRPASPFGSMLLGAAATAGVVPFTMMGKQSTPGGNSGYVSGGSTPYQDIGKSPLSPDEATVAGFLAGPKAAKYPLLPPSVLDPIMFSHREETFSPNPGFDALAEDMAKHLELW